MRLLFPAYVSTLAACLTLAAPAPAQVPPAPLPILFVGNSFMHGRYLPVRTYNAAAITDENFGLPQSNPRSERIETGPFGGIPGIFKQFTVEAGLSYDVHIEAVSAQTLEFHYEQALPIITQTPWDAVVLQDFSTGPLPEARGGHPERFYKYATLLEQAIHTLNPQTKLYLYETWPRAELIFPPGKAYSGEGTGAMTTELHEAYWREAAQDGHFAAVIPIGDAWQRAIEQGVAQPNPYQNAGDDRINLWGEDGYHPSVAGAYLTALVCFQRITGQDARRLGKDEQAAAALGLAPEAAVTLQRVAWEQVTGGQN